MPISTLPGEIVVDILSRLPVKSLIRFRCVSKSWRSLISNTRFIKFHLNRVIQDVNVARHRVLLSTFQSIDYEASNDASMELDFLTRVVEHDLEFAGSCHGLVCLVFDYDNVVICNPSTRDSRELPKPSTLSGHSFAYGFSYDSSVDDFKVVRVATPAYSSNSSTIQVEVFSLRSTSWRRIEDIHPNTTMTGQGAFSNGALHWLVTRETGCAIVSFNMAKEEFEEVVSLPEQVDKSVSICDDLDVLGGYLVITRDYCNLYREVWVMKEYGVEASWSKMFTILCDENAPQYEDWMAPKSLSKNGEALMDVDGRKLVMYNPKEKTFRNVAVDGDWDWFKTVIYAETLVSPNGNYSSHSQIESKKEELDSEFVYYV